MLIVRGMFAYAIIVLNYTALRLIPLGDVTAINITSPVLLTMLAAFVFDETLTCIRLACVILGLCGITLIAKPLFIIQLFRLQQSELISSVISHEQQVIGCTCAFLTALFVAICFVLVRRMPKINLRLVRFWDSFGSLLCALIHLSCLKFVAGDPSARLPIDLHETTCVVISILCGVGGQFTLNLALKVEQSGPISLARAADIVISFSLQALFLRQEQIGLLSLVGAFVIFVATSMTAIEKWSIDRKRTPVILHQFCSPSHKNSDPCAESGKPSDHSTHVIQVLCVSNLKPSIKPDSC
jgi:drug/metabolite transporter (DMT)-like permease